MANLDNIIGLAKAPSSGGFLSFVIDTSHSECTYRVEINTWDGPVKYWVSIKDMTKLKKIANKAGVKTYYMLPVDEKKDTFAVHNEAELEDAIKNKVVK